MEMSNVRLERFLLRGNRILKRKFVKFPMDVRQTDWLPGFEAAAKPFLHTWQANHVK